MKVRPETQAPIATERDQLRAELDHWRARAESAEREAERMRAELDEAWAMTGSGARGLASLAEVIASIRDERGQLRVEVEKWKRYKAAIDEALNSGNGVYRP